MKCGSGRHNDAADRSGPNAGARRQLPGEPGGPDATGCGRDGEPARWPEQTGRERAVEYASASHDFVDHTAELALRVRAPSFAALLSEAVSALGELFVDEAGSAGAAEARAIRLEALDREALLVDLLNEILFLAESEAWAPSPKGVVVEADATHASLSAEGVRLAGRPSRIKGATLHGLAVRFVGGLVEAEVILDV
jgi:SHS2 domain-containing protein